MRPLTSEERVQLNHIRDALGVCVEDRHELLADFLEKLALPDPMSVAENASRFLPDVAAWVDAQVIRPEDRAWLLLRLALLVGESLAQRYGGSWYLDDMPDSPHFARYVVGNFETIAGSNARIDPFHVVNEYLSVLEVRGPIPNPAVGATTYVFGRGDVFRSLLSVVAEAASGLRPT